MICPSCNANDDKVIDSRASEGGRVIRRRRECLKCHKRFTTYERIEQASRLMVVKRDGSRVPFDREKILLGVSAACGKRPVPAADKQQLVDEVEEELQREFEREVDSAEIGRRVMHKLRNLDDVAYIRFASEHHQFRSVEDIMKELQSLSSRPRDARNQQDLFP
ncbi:MAG: transcriptional regulator NrdR [Phycisphaerales bacterium JB037]